VASINQEQHLMKYGKAALLVIVLALFSPVSANKKARVITESGKKWDVLFLKMSKDTIYLKARKPSGAVFSISGHKSKFRKVEFSDGSQLDFSLSDFPLPDNKKKNTETVGGVGDTVFLYEPSSQLAKNDTVFPAGRHNDSTSLGTTPTVLQSSSPKPDSVKSQSFAVDTSGGQSPNKQPLLDSESMISLETKPANVAVKKDEKAFAGIGEKKKSRGFAIALGLLSAASFAGSAGSYFLYNRHLPSEQQTFDDLNNSVVKGSNAETLIEKNKTQHENAQLKLTASNILLGAGVLFLATGIIFYF
jgi:hypothetical protein